MDRREVYSRFIANGLSLDPTAMEFFASNGDLIQEFIESSEKMRSSGAKTPSIVTMGHVMEVIGPRAEPATKEAQPTHPEAKEVEPQAPEPAKVPYRPKPSVLKRYLGAPPKTIFSTDDALSIAMSQYEKAKVLISSKLPSNTVSIKKIQPSGRLSLIAMVSGKSYDDNTLTIQDSTGETSVKVPEKKEFEGLMEGDIVGLGCESGPGGLTASIVVYPDISMKRKIETPDQESFVAFAPVLSTTGIDIMLGWVRGFAGRDRLNVVIVAGDLCEGDDGGSSKISEAVGGEHVLAVSEPSMLSFDGVKVLVCPGCTLKEYEGQWGDAENTAVNILKRRDLAPGTTIADPRALSDKTFFDETPDIFATSLSGPSDKPSSSNYKGVSIINTVSSGTSAGVFVVNLKTREVIKFDLRYD